MEPYMIEVTLVNGQVSTLVSTFKSSGHFIEFLRKTIDHKNYIPVRGDAYINPKAIASFRCYETGAQ